MNRNHRIFTLTASTLLLALVVVALPGLAGPNPSDEQDVSASDLSAGYYDSWLRQVAPLLSPAEARVFRRLTTDDHRDAFIEAFWRARDATPETLFNEYRERYERQVQGAWNSFSDLQDDRAQMVLLHGPPRYTHLVQCELLKPLHLFYFPRTSYRPGPMSALFIGETSKGGTTRFRLWPATSHPTQLLVDDRPTGESLTEILDRAQGDGCFTGKEQVRGFLQGALDLGLDWRGARQRLGWPAPDETWLQSFEAVVEADQAVPSTEGAALEVDYPSKIGGRTILQGVLRLPAAQVSTSQEQLAAAQGEVSSGGMESSFLLTGFVEPRAESPKTDAPMPPRQLFRQRFHIDPASVAGDKTVVLFFHRDLEPGTYDLTLRLQDAVGRSLLRDHRRIVVPMEVAKDAAAPPSEAMEITPENLALWVDRVGAQILPMPGLHVGTTAIDVVTVGRGIAMLRYAVDGKPLGIDATPPWDISVDLGPEPRPHEVEVTALDADGNVLASDSLRLNAGAHRFAVRLLEPKAEETYRDLVPVRAAVEVPAGADLERLEIFRQESVVATLYQPPFVHVLTLDSPQQATYIKVVAHLTDGSVASDLAVINLPGAVEEIDVREVELFANVFDRRKRPVNDLGVENFAVMENGRPQQIQKVERVEDLPVHVSLLIDSSSSMADEMTLSIDSAERFFETVLTPEDQAAVITFNHRTRLAVPFTRDLAWLSDGVSTLSADGGTALWDSIISSLHYFGGLEGKRALVLLSDGDDQHSRFKFDDTRDFAQRAGVAVYAISLDVGWEVPDNDMPGLSVTGTAHVSETHAWELKNRHHRRRLERLAKETGGLFFHISSTKTLDKAFRAIEEDMRAQYLITYQSSTEGDGFRSVELETEPRKLKVRTIGGYYP